MKAYADRGLPEAVDLLASPTSESAASVSVRFGRSGRWTIVEIEGEMDIQALGLVKDLVASSSVHVIFELHGVTFLDACGLGMMVSTQRKARGMGGCVRLVAPSSQVRRLLRLTGCDQLFPLFDTVGEAVAMPTHPGPGLAS